MHDLLIKNGTIIDGAGDPMYLGDVAINSGVITEVGDLSGEKTVETIDAKGLYVCPGFIDISNRSDVYWRLFTDPLMESLLRQGITTIIGGNSGSSLAPIYSKDMLLSTQKWADVSKVNVDWSSMKDYLSVLDDQQLALNFGTFVGHGTLRRGLVSDEMRPLEAEELTSMVKHVRESLEAGAFGVSLGLLYTHALDATKEELVRIAEVIKEYDALLSVHLRNEDRELLEALGEIFSVTQTTDARTHITHLKAVGSENWSLMPKALELCGTMRAMGHYITFDVYPYTHTGSVLYTFLPQWVTAGGKKMMLSRLRNEKIRAQVEKELLESQLNFGKAVISVAPERLSLRGKTIASLAAEVESQPVPTMIDLLLASEGRIIIIFDSLSKENLMRELDSPYSIVTSNAPGYTIDRVDHNSGLHPRSFGSFPRLLKRYVRDQKVLSWETAIYKSTAKVAASLGIKDRGRIAANFHADIAIIDPVRINDLATIDRPLQYAEGVDHVVIGGEVVVSHGQLQDARPGKILRHK